MYKTYRKIKQMGQEQQLCHFKVVKAITNREAKEKRLILLSQY